MIACCLHRHPLIGIEATRLTPARSVMERLANYLDGLDGYVGAIIESHNDMLAEFYDS